MDGSLTFWCVECGGEVSIFDCSHAEDEGGVEPP